MKKIYLWAAGLFLMYSAQGQTLTSSINPEIGDTYTNFMINVSGILPGNAGSGQSWNFADRVVEGTRPVSVVDPADDNYPNANVEVKEQSGEILYYQTSNNQLLNWGYKSNNIGTAVFTDPQIVMTYPFALNSTVTDSIKGTNTYQGMPLILKGKSVTVADGSGSLTLPKGISYTNALRLKTVQTIRDSSSMFTVDIQITSYQWYVDTIPHPVFSIVYIETQLLNDTIAYMSTSVATPVKKEMAFVKQIEVYPNPASDHVNLSYHLDKAVKVKITLKDAAGRQLKVVADEYRYTGHNLQTVDLSGMKKGTYMMEIEADGATQVKKVTIH